MATYGGYESVRQFSASASHTMWTARAAGAAGEPQFALRIARLEDLVDLLGPEDAAREIAALYDSAVVQERLAKAEGSRWAQVHTKAKSDECAYCVMDLYFDGGVPSSGQSLIRGAGAARLTHPMLRAIVEAAAGALAQIHAMGRPHGRLKPSNVLIAWVGDVPSRVVVTDPAPGDAVKARSIDDDLAALGELIHEVVLKKPFIARGGWPLPDDDAWRTLGNTGEEWRRLCEALLNPARKPGEITAESIPAMLPVERPKTKRTKLIAVVGIGALVLIVGGGIVLSMMEKRNGDGDAVVPEAVRRERWQEIEQHDGDWLSAVRSWVAMERKNAPMPDLAARIDRILTARGINPESSQALQHIFLEASKQSGVLAMYGYQNPDVWKRAETFWPAIEEIRAEITAWAASLRIEEGAVAADSLGWSRTAGLLRARGRAPEFNREIVAWIKQARDANTLAEKLPELDRKVEAVRQAGERLSDPLLVRIGEIVVEPPADDGIAQYVERRLDLVTRALEAATAPHVAQIAVMSEFRDEVQQAADRVDQLTDDEVRRWVWIVGSESYQLVDVSQSVSDFKAQLAQASQHLAAMPSQSEECLARKARVEANVREVLAAVEEYELIKPIGMYEADLRALASRIEARLAPLRSEAAALVTCGVVDPREILETMRRPGAEHLMSGSSVLQGEFRARLDAAASAPLERIPDKKRRLDEVFKAVDEGTRVDRLESPRFADMLNERRERALRELLAGDAWRRAWSGDEPPSVDAFTSTLDAIRTDLESFKATAAGIDRRADDLRRRVDSAEVFDAQARGETAGFLRDAAEFQPRLSNLWPTLESLVRVWSLEDRAKSAVDRGAVADPAVQALVVEAQRPSHHAVGFEAWRALDALGGPGVTLAMLSSLYDGLSQIANTAPQESRRRELLASARADVARHWTRLVRNAGSPEEVDQGWIVARSLSINPAESEDAVVAYNWHTGDLARWLSGDGASADDAAVTARIRTFVDLAKPLADRAGRPEHVVLLLEKLEVLLAPSDEAPAAPPAKQGPAGMPDSLWVGEELPAVLDGVARAKYTWRVDDPSGSRMHELEFVYVEPSPGQGAYLSTTEVSIGLFIDLFTAGRPDQGHLHRAAADTLLPRRSSQSRSPAQAWGSITGPHGWVWGEADVNRPENWHMRVADAWIDPHTYYRRPFVEQATERPVYPPDLVQVLERDQAPTAQHPMHWVRPDAAVYAAWLAGCRLPTPEEWRAASALNQAFEHGSPGAIVPNLRDHVGRQQAQYMLVNAAWRGASPAVLPDYGSLHATIRATVDDWPQSPRAGDDVMWFAPVDACGGIFKHLVGNVAEIVVTSDRVSEMNEARGVNPEPEAANSFAASNADSFRIIGASAQSPQDVNPSEPLSNVMRNNRPLLRGFDWRFSDVGFRLAFSADRKRPMAGRAADILASTQRYILAQASAP